MADDGDWSDPDNYETPDDFEWLMMSASPERLRFYETIRDNPGVRTFELATTHRFSRGMIGQHAMWWRRKGINLAWIKAYGEDPETGEPDKRPHWGWWLPEHLADAFRAHREGNRYVWQRERWILGSLTTLDMVINGWAEKFPEDTFLRFGARSIRRALEDIRDLVESNEELREPTELAG